MPRIDLHVPFSEKDEVKKLGAKWDAQNRVWFIPMGVPPEPFSKWRVPEELEKSLLAILGREMFVAETETVCWKCNKRTKVFALPLLHPHYDIESRAPESEDHYTELSESGEAHFMCYTNFLTEDYIKFLGSIAPTFRVDYSKTIEVSYWMNHCEHCDAKIGDFNLIDDGGAFDILSEEQAKTIRIKRRSGYMEAECRELSRILFLDHIIIE